ncbi:hypothetical protein D5086_002056 [Populus alba]|uniref:Uncharacterized protein n=2 Tax=Populus alba TaxID=43335 RepID=A0ACC4D0I8_POPAL|nr:hypothetical protein D5086_0000082800 [Populus alba]
MDLPDCEAQAACAQDLDELAEARPLLEPIELHRNILFHGIFPMSRYGWGHSLYMWLMRCGKFDGTLPSACSNYNGRLTLLPRWFDDAARCPDESRWPVYFLGIMREEF